MRHPQDKCSFNFETSQGSVVCIYLGTDLSKYLGIYLDVSMYLR